MRLIEGRTNGEGEPDIFIVKDATGRSDEVERGIVSLAMTHLYSSALEARAMADDMITGIADDSKIPAHTVPLLCEMLKDGRKIMVRRQQILRAVGKMTDARQYVSSREVIEDLRCLKTLGDDDPLGSIGTADGLLGRLTDKGVRPSYWEVGNLELRCEAVAEAAEVTGATMFGYQYEIVRSPGLRDRRDESYRLLSEREHTSLGKEENGEFIPLVTVLDIDHPVVARGKTMGNHACGFATIKGTWNELKLPK